MHLLDLYKPLFSAVFAAATAVVAAAPLDESVWFFADFDSPVTVGGRAYEDSLAHPPGGKEKMGRPLRAWALARRDAWRKGMAAWSEEDGDGSYTFAKELDGMRFVIVVNDTRADDRGIFGTFCTNDWYRPLCAARRIRTHLRDAAGLTVTLFNPTDGNHAVTVGREGVVEGDFAPGESKVYCLASRPPAELSLGLRGEPCVGGKVELALSLVAKDGSPQRGRQVVRLRVRRPDGSAADESGLAVLSGGTGSVVLRFAHDDERGSFFRKWKVEAEDLATGLTADLSFALK